jgi:hypothetical protein
VTAAARFLVFLALFGASASLAIAWSIIGSHPVAEFASFSAGINTLGAISAFIHWREEAKE